MTHQWYTVDTTMKLQWFCLQYMINFSNLKVTQCHLCHCSQLWLQHQKVTHVHNYDCHTDTASQMWHNVTLSMVTTKIVAQTQHHKSYTMSVFTTVTIKQTEHHTVTKHQSISRHNHNYQIITMQQYQWLFWFTLWINYKEEFCSTPLHAHTSLDVNLSLPVNLPIFT